MSIGEETFIFNKKQRRYNRRSLFTRHNQNTESAAEQLAEMGVTVTPGSQRYICSGCEATLRNRNKQHRMEDLARLRHPGSYVASKLEHTPPGLFISCLVYCS